MNKPTATTSTDWKDRCRLLLDELESNTTNWQNTEKLLYRVIARLSNATAGLDSVIDPHLGRIRELLRKGVNTDELRIELESISEALFRAANESHINTYTAAAAVSENSPDITKPSEEERFELVLTFLKTLSDSQAETDQLDEMRNRVRKAAFADESEFFRELKKQMETLVLARPEPAVAKDKSEKKGLLGRLFGLGRKSEAPEKVDLAVIQKNLIALLDAGDMLGAARNKASRLIEQLKVELEKEELLAIFQEAVELLANLKSRTEVEQKFFEEFLSDLSSRLIELEQRTVGINRLAKSSQEGSTARHAAFSDHVESLRSTTHEATEINQLKSQLTARLALVSDYLASERDAELKRTQEMEDQLIQMSAKLQEMEQESMDLHTRLRAEHNMAMRDALTGLPNRLAYDERIAQEISRWKRFQQPFCLLVWDVDHFKSINDRFGHKAGDKALVTIAEILSNSIRETDFVGRFGGEEFVMILVGTDAQNAANVAENIRAKVEVCGFNSNGKPVQITISCGISQLGDDESHEQAFERADQALYRAKHGGRNRCVIADTSISPVQ